MKLRTLLLSFLCMASLMASAMTDQEVITYIKQQMAAGKSDQQIGKELMAKGVTPEQAKRIKTQLEAENVTEKKVAGTSTDAFDQERAHSSATEISAESVDNIQREIDEGGDDKVSARQIYGHKVFNAQALTFEPSDNIATPKNYVLGPGDEVIIDIWGTSEDHLRQIISPEGSIMIAQIGPVYLNGKTIDDANRHIKNLFANKYAGVEDAETDVQLTLGQVRTIQVNVIGEAATQGTYRMSPFSTVLHALYRAGGINDIGSLRNIQVSRNGRKIADVDIYDFLFKQSTAGNLRLQEGDVIYIPTYSQLVNVTGNVKRPMYYEIKQGETLKQLLDYAGGFTGNAYSDMVKLSRQEGNENHFYNIERADFDTYELKDGDMLTVGTILDRYSNRVEVKGSVYRPGLFALSSDINTVSELISKAEGLTDDAYTDRALLYREGPNLELEIEAVNLNAILNKQVPDIPLRRNDILVISSIHELEARGDLSITGQIAHPGRYPFAINTTLEDLILQAGGLLEGASTARVEVSRRVIEPSSTTPTQQLSEIFTLSIENGLAVGDAKGFILKPYDLVTVFRSPGYAPQEKVEIGGEVVFPGYYVIERRSERLSDIVRRAGGLIPGAYLKGAHLSRELSEAEYIARREALRLAMANAGGESGDSISLSKIEVSRHYTVGIDLEKALANPGSTYDLVVRPGDDIYIPEQQSVVKISGEVMFPNSVVYEPGKKFKYYIEQAGGYGQVARKNKVFIVYQNGTVALAKGKAVIEPGCHIIVPAKSRTSGPDWTKILAFATSFSSVAALGATITNIFKK